MCAVGPNKMDLGKSREELVIEEKKAATFGGSKGKWLIAIAVVLAVMTILFIGLYAAERKKLKDMENESANAAAKGSPATKPPPTKKPPITIAPTRKPATPGADVTKDNVLVAASKSFKCRSDLI